MSIKNDLPYTPPPSESGLIAKAIVYLQSARAACRAIHLAHEDAVLLEIESSLRQMLSDTHPTPPAMFAMPDPEL